MRDPQEVIADPCPKGVQAHQVTGIVVAVEYIDNDGDMRLAFQHAATHWRAIGMLDTAITQWRQDLLDEPELPWSDDG